MTFNIQVKLVSGSDGEVSKLPCLFFYYLTQNLVLIKTGSFSWDVSHFPDIFVVTKTEILNLTVFSSPNHMVFAVLMLSRA